MKIKINPSDDALIVTDIQIDFCPGGALPVLGGDKIIPVLNSYIEKFQRARARIYATRDWHPPNHISFKAHGGPWPPHCIQGSKGAEFHPNLKLPKDVKVISKATNPLREAYSALDGTNLEEDLKIWGVKRIFIGGLATDYCVLNTSLDALKLGFKVVLLSDATQGIDVSPGDSAKAMKEMVKKGAKKATLSDID